MDDKERIEFIIKDKGLSNVEFSSITGIAPATISHITSGRSKPTLPILKGILSGFPDLNPEWVFLGTGPIYKEGSDPSEADAASTAKVDSYDLFSSFNSQDSSLNSEKAGVTKVSKPQKSAIETTDIQDTIRKTMMNCFEQSRKREIVEVRIFFDDGTYEAFNTPKIK